MNILKTLDRKLELDFLSSIYCRQECHLHLIVQLCHLQVLVSTSLPYIFINRGCLAMQNLDSLCEQYAKMVNGKADVQHGVCSVELKRNLNVTIQGRPSTSELHAGISFESIDHQGFALNLGEVVVLENELPPFVNELVKNNIIISAIHNHWLFTNPTILYVHFQSVEPPLSFAQKTAKAFRTLKY